MGPVMALLTFNLVIFVMVVIVLVKHSRKRIQTIKHKSVKVTIRTLISMVGIVFLFGLTWVFGAFTTTQKSQLPFLILFVVFSSFQGFFVFLFFCVFNGDARQAWNQFLTCGSNGKRKIIYQQKTRELSKPSKDSTSHPTLSATLERSSQPYSTPDTNRSILSSKTTQVSISFVPLTTDEYDMQEMQTEIYRTTEEMHLNEGALDTDISVTVHPTSPVHGFMPDNIMCAVEGGLSISNPGALEDIPKEIP